MKMDRFFTGLVALVAGLALSAGSAYATKGYLMGDAAPSKLVPHYEIGDTKATIIGVQNMASGDNDTKECETTGTATATDGDAVALVIPLATAPEVCKLDLDDDPNNAKTVATSASELATATAAANADDAQNLIVTAMAYGPSGKMQAATDICLAPGAFGYFVIGKMAMDMEMGANGAMLSMADGIGTDGTMETKNDDGTTTTGPNHVYNGYVTLVASDRVKFCDGRRTPSDEPVKITFPNSDDTSNANSEIGQIANPAIAAWTIVQDIGDGFFGVEVPTPTVTMNRGEGNTIVGDGMLDCYDTEDGTDAAIADSEFDQMKCGLIPERHNNDRISATEFADAGFAATNIAGAEVGDPDTRAGTDVPGTGHATPRAKATVRYDTMDETTVFVWVGATETMLDVAVHCEEGMETSIDDPSADTSAMLGTATIMVPGMTKMIDPAMGEIGDFTSTCTGSRGVLEITMPDGSHAGMVWSHITQMGGHYRMNFPGYSMASNQSCRSMAGADDNDNDDKAARDMCM